MVARAGGHRRHRLLVFLDSGLATAQPNLSAEIEAYAAAHSARLDLAMQPIWIPGGEEIKNDPVHIARVQDAVRAHGIDRHSFVVGVGGGAVLDAIGFAAATVHRSVRHIRVPTTVLSQNDSGVGVKNAINFRGAKNFIGTFAPPWAVINDFWPAPIGWSGLNLNA